jgi:hypothetical protein
MTITAAVCLSLYRVENSRTNLALFITFSTINGIYTCKSQRIPNTCGLKPFINF